MLTRRFPRLYHTLVNKYFVDEAYDAVIVDPVVKVSDEILWKGIDVTFIDGMVNASARVMNAIAQVLRKIQTGVAQSYAVVFIGGILFVISWLLFK